MLEQSLITHCAPTLAGLKTAGLFCFSYTSESMLQAELRRCRLALGNKGVLLPASCSVFHGLRYDKCL